MTAKEAVLKELLEGKVIKTTAREQARFGINQMPDVIRKIKKTYGRDCIERTMIKVVYTKSTTRVAEYRMPIEWRRKIRGSK